MMADTLRWIPTLNPTSDEAGHGINFCGPTAFLSSGARVAERVFRTWAEMFRLGLDELVLTGSWSEIVGEAESGCYQQLRFDRNHIVGNLLQIADHFHQTATSGGAYFVLHLGV